MNHAGKKYMGLFVCFNKSNRNKNKFSGLERESNINKQNKKKSEKNFFFIRGKAKNKNSFKKHNLQDKQRKIKQEQENFKEKNYVQNLLIIIKVLIIEKNSFKNK